jgi:hypothetical protein
MRVCARVVVGDAMVTSKLVSRARRLLSDQSATITLRQACAVVDALGPDTRNELVDIFCRQAAGGREGLV